MKSELNNQSRAQALLRLRSELLDVLVVGGGIVGAAVAREAAERGLSVGLVERRDFATGASSTSSKLVHGGLRYLANLELGLVFESLRERKALLGAAPHLVRPQPFYLPVYEGERPGRAAMGAGLMLYDLLSAGDGLPRHARLSKEELLSAVPSLEPKGLLGGFRYHDATMSDDALVVETLREAAGAGAAIASFVEVKAPVWSEGRLYGFVAEDVERPGSSFTVRAKQVVLAAGAWTDVVCRSIDPSWQSWLRCSKGVHLVLPLQKLPVPGAVVMMSPEDGRASFVVPRPDLGGGVVLVGTTDGPAPDDPSQVRVEPEDVTYLLELIARTFPGAGVGHEDILSAFAGVRPLLRDDEGSLQGASREHRIERGPGGAVVIAGGKYTTHRAMAREAVELLGAPRRGRKERDDEAAYVSARLASARRQAAVQELEVPEALWSRYGAEAVEVVRGAKDSEEHIVLAGFPLLAAQLRHAVRREGVLHLEDFYFRRVPLFLARKDHGLPWARALARVLVEARGLPEGWISVEVARLEAAIARREGWKSDRPPLRTAG